MLGGFHASAAANDKIRFLEIDLLRFGLCERDHLDAGVLLNIHLLFDDLAFLAWFTDRKRVRPERHDQHRIGPGSDPRYHLAAVKRFLDLQAVTIEIEPDRI